jgi:hypothetical protein
LKPLGVSKTESMKKVYTGSVIPYGMNISENIAKATVSSNNRLSRLRGIVAVMLGFCLLINSTILRAQNCATSGTHTQSVNENTYYPGTTAAVAAGTTTISLGAAGVGANFGNTPIAVGDIVLVIQMQGAKINLPASNQDSKYGANLTGVGAGFLSTNEKAGTMEFAVAASAVPLAGGVLTVGSGLSYSYASSVYGADGQYTYQVIRVPSWFNIQLTSTVTAPKWNGAVGGVTVISAVSQLDFNGQLVTALGAGFRGGGGITKSGAPGTTIFDFYTTAATNANGSKGEGIAGSPRYMMQNFTLIDNVVEGYPGGSFAKGAPGNAGGGATDSNPTANDQNAGGGGGGNGGVGGNGGNGWLTFGVSGGMGGSTFRASKPVNTFYISPSVFIMGGGGGAGDTNNSTGSLGALSSSGASGGGIVIINASTITGVGNIDVSGATFEKFVLNDGSGGGGAGGSILIYANSGHAGITATALGGVGIANYPASVAATQHGPGGGGGGGVIFSNGALNVASSVAGGAAGLSYGASTTNSFNALAGDPGVLTQTFPLAQLPPKMQICQSVVLPVTLLTINASYVSANNVKVNWTTTDEINADYFEVERSTDATNFIGVAQVNASESLSPVHSYSINDQLYNINGNIIYYRLRIVDKDGKYSYTRIIPVKLDQPETNLSVYPNPVDGYTILNMYSDKQATGVLRLIDNSGKQIITKSFTISNGNNSVMIDQLGALPKGIYVIQVLVNNNLYNQKIIKK